MQRAWVACVLAGVAASAACGSNEALENPAPAAEARPEVRFWEHFRAARRAGRDGDIIAAIDRFEQALRIDPKHRDTLYYLGQLRYQRDELEAAAGHLERLALLEPRALRPWQQLSVLRGRPVAGFEVALGAAKQAANRALSLNPAESRNHLLAARWAAYEGETQAALASLHKALGHNPQLWEAYLLWLWLEPDAAESIQQQVVERLCGGDEGRGPACASHAALHVALEAALGPAAEAPLIAPAEASSPAGAVAAAKVRVRDLLAWSTGQPARWSLEVEPATQGEVWEVAGSNSVLVTGSGGRSTLLPRFGASGPAVPKVTGTGWLHGVPWRAASLRLRTDETANASSRAVVVVGGAGVGVRYFDNQQGPWSALTSEGLPDLLSGAVATSADFDGDGVDELFLANVALTPGGSEIGGTLFAISGRGRFTPTGLRVPGPLTAALATDLDDDGDPDLLVAHLPPPRAMATYLQLSPDIATTSLPEPVVSLWRNRNGTLVLEPEAVPATWARVQEFAVGDFDADGDPDIYLATGSLAAEIPEPDLLWLQGEDRFVDATPALGGARFGASLRAWAAPGGGVVVLRGGLVPGAPQRLLRITPDVRP